MELKEQIDRAARAKALLDNDLFQEAFQKTRDLYIETLLAAPEGDERGRERLWLMIKLLERVKAHFGTIMADGELARAELKRLTEADEQKRFTDRFKVKHGRN